MEDACRRFPGRIILSIDARGGKVAIQGWSDIVPLEAVELVREFEGMGFSAIVFTDIERDGMETGLNWEMTKTIAQVDLHPGDCVGRGLPD